MVLWPLGFWRMPTNTPPRDAGRQVVKKDPEKGKVRAGAFILATFVSLVNPR